MKTEDEMRELLRETVAAGGMSARAWAKQHDIHQGQLSDTLAGKLPVTTNIAQALGYKPVRVYVKRNET